MRALLGVFTLLSVVVVSAGRATAQSPCDPVIADECRSSYMCNEQGFCEGQPTNEGMPCSTDSTGGCMTDGVCLNGTCVGMTAKPDNSPCVYPGLGKCYTGSHCMTIAGVFSICTLGAPKSCPPSSDPCKGSVCNPETGECVTGDKCFTFYGCERCNAGTCEPVNIGGRCANQEGDFNPCTNNDRCAILDIPGGFAPAGLSGTAAAAAMGGGAVGRGLCMGTAGGEPEPTVTVGPPPTDTPNAPPTVPATFTPTSTGPEATPTPTQPGTVACVGDCDGTGEVTVDELLKMVNISLGSLPIDACIAGDANGDSEITVDEIVRAVNNALNGCP